MLLNSQHFKWELMIYGIRIIIYVTYIFLCLTDIIFVNIRYYLRIPELSRAVKRRRLE